MSGSSILAQCDACRCFLPPKDHQPVIRGDDRIGNLVPVPSEHSLSVMRFSHPTCDVDIVLLLSTHAQTKIRGHVSYIIPLHDMFLMINSISQLKFPVSQFLPAPPHLPSPIPQTNKHKWSLVCMSGCFCWS